MLELTYSHSIVGSRLENCNIGTMGFESIVTLLHLTAVVLCLVGSVSAGSDSIESDEGASWIDGEQLSEDRCQILITKHAWPTADDEVSSSRTLQFCKQHIEKNTLNQLSELKADSRERVNTLVESMIAANGDENFKGE